MPVPRHMSSHCYTALADQEQKSENLLKQNLINKETQLVRSTIKITLYIDYFKFLVVSNQRHNQSEGEMFNIYRGSWRRNDVIHAIMWSKNRCNNCFKQTYHTE